MNAAERRTEDLHTEDLRARVEVEAASETPDRAVFDEFLDALTQGRIRAASPEGDTWVVHEWVKRGILMGFRLGQTQDFSIDQHFRFFDKDTYPPRPTTLNDGIRVVPGGSTIRAGAYVAPGVVCMPPMYVNVGAWVGSGSMIDSHALVGSCAQIGERVHISAGAQIGGVLEPVGALPVIVEDGALVGGNCGLYEGVRIGAEAVLAPGTILTRGTPLIDLVNDRVIRAKDGEPLQVPAGAVVVPGSRPARGEFAASEGVHLYAPVVVKYRDATTAAAVDLEDALR